MIVMNLIERTMQEDYKQLLEDNQRITELISRQEESDLLVNYFHSLNVSLNIFRRNYEKEMGFKYLYDSLRKKSMEMAIEVMIKYKIKPNKKLVLGVSSQ